MTERGSVLLEGVLGFLLLLAAALLLAQLLHRGLQDRLEDHADFVQARRSLRQ